MLSLSALPIIVIAALVLALAAWCLGNGKGGDRG